jgi:GH24 family phage-related lysozyme (muramidase)
VNSRCVELSRRFISSEEMDNASLDAALRAGEELLNVVVVAPLTLPQRDALVCLFSDVLANRSHSLPKVVLKDSRIVQAVNSGQLQIAAAEFHSFCFRNGKAFAELYKKRNTESLLFVKGVLLS